MVQGFTGVLWPGEPRKYVGILALGLVVLLGFYETELFIHHSFMVLLLARLLLV
jgi:hypothetical protein